MEQTSLFANLEKQERRAIQDKLFLEWKALPDEVFIPADSQERAGVHNELARAYCLLWKVAHHRCREISKDVYIWLNEVEPPEYWVLNKRGNPCGEHIDKCPYCGVDLKHGGGDVIMLKADDAWWRILGYIEEGEENDKG